MLKIDDENNVYLTRGDSAHFIIQIFENDGVTPYAMQTGDHLLFTVRRLYDKGEIVITKDFTTPEFFLQPEDTFQLTFGRYQYDIALYNTNHFISTILADKSFTVGEEVHDFA